MHMRSDTRFQAGTERNRRANRCMLLGCYWDAVVDVHMPRYAQFHPPLSRCLVPAPAPVSPPPSSSTPSSLPHSSSSPPSSRVSSIPHSVMRRMTCMMNSVVGRSRYGHTCIHTYTYTCTCTQTSDTDIHTHTHAQTRTHITACTQT